MIPNANVWEDRCKHLLLTGSMTVLPSDPDYEYWLRRCEYPITVNGIKINNSRELKEKVGNDNKNRIKKMY